MLPWGILSMVSDHGKQVGSIPKGSIVRSFKRDFSHFTISSCAWENQRMGQKKNKANPHRTLPLTFPTSSCDPVGTFRSEGHDVS